MRCAARRRALLFGRSHTLSGLLLLLTLTLALAPAAFAADDLMPLAEVRPGLACRGLTVVRGTEISDFRADVVDVVSESFGGPAIIVRVAGGAAEPSGVVEGFSGSPILCPGSDGRERIAGALAATTGDKDNRLAVATPIEELLRVTPLPPIRQAPERAGPAGSTATGANASLAKRSSGGSSTPMPRLRPLRAPLVVGGVSRRLLARLARVAARHGVAVTAAASAPASGPAASDLRPGSAIAAALVAGDVSAAAVGTLTYRDGNRVWAFGHPLGDLSGRGGGPGDGLSAGALGRRSLFLQSAYVFGVVDAPTTPLSAAYKLAAPTPGILGSITNDRRAGVAGLIGAPPASIPLEVGVRDLDTGRAVTLRAAVADETPLDIEGGPAFGVALTVAAALDRAVGAEAPRTTDRLCLSLVVRQLPLPLGGCGTFFDGGAVDVATLATTLVERFDRAPLGLSAIRIRLRRRSGAPEAFIDSASGPRRARPGSTITVAVRVTVRRGGRRTLRFPLRLPRKLRPGTTVVRIRALPVDQQSRGAGSDLENALSALFSGQPLAESDLPAPRSPLELAFAVRSLLPVNGIAARIGKAGDRLVWRNDAMRLRGRAQFRLRIDAPRRR